MTGAKSVQLAMSCGELFCRCLSELFDTPFSVTLLTIQLVNACCRLNLNENAVISLNTFKDYILAEDFVKGCFYNNDQHAGLRVKIPYTCSSGHDHTSTCIIFSSGSVLFNAFLSGSELKHAFEFITRIFLQRKQQLVMPKLQKEYAYVNDFDYNKYL